MNYLQNGTKNYRVTLGRHEAADTQDPKPGVAEQDPRYELIENFGKYRIGIDDVFAFKCRACSKCCRQRFDILLNSRDIYNLAVALNLTHQQVIEEYCEVYIGENSRLPVVSLKPKGSNNNCPLLNGSKCLIHAINPALKPVVCAAYPIGRVVMAENAHEMTAAQHAEMNTDDVTLDEASGVDDEVVSETISTSDSATSNETPLENQATDEETPAIIHSCKPGQIEYILMPVTCASLKKKQTVRTWLEGFGIPIEDKFFLKWNDTVFKLTAEIQKYEEKANGNNSKVTPNAVSMLWDGIYSALYVAYNPQQEFYQQFVVNATKILSIFDKLEGYVVIDGK